MLIIKIREYESLFNFRILGKTNYNQIGVSEFQFIFEQSLIASDIFNLFQKQTTLWIFYS